MKTKKKLLDLVRDKIRFKHPIDMAKKEIEDFLTFLATKKRVSPTTQNQAKVISPLDF